MSTNRSPSVALSHQLILQAKGREFALDATCGNGHDTRFLAQHFKQVLGTDIQPLAIRRTLQQITEYTNVKILLHSHETIHEGIHQPIDAILFNLGFLPGGNRHITTHGETTVLAIQHLLPLLKKGGKCILVLYSQHDHGLESNTIMNYLQFHSISHTIYNVEAHVKVVDITSI
jgi:SAM-dependent methyltransferase